MWPRPAALWGKSPRRPRAVVEWARSHRHSPVSEDVMRGPSLLRPLAVVAGVLGLAAPGTGQPPDAKGGTAFDVEKLLAIKPFEVGDSDSPLLKLQKER